MIKLHELIGKAAEEHVEIVKLKEQITGNKFIEDLSSDCFTAGAEFVVNNIMALQNHFPLMGVITIQVDPNATENKLISANMSGLNPMELVELLMRFAQGQLDKTTGMAQELVLMPKVEAARRRAFEDSLAVVREERKLYKPD